MTDIELPDLSRYDRIGWDTETTGVAVSSRPTGCSIAAPDGRGWYFSWGAGDRRGLDGPPEMNNISLARFRDWAKVELARPGARRIAHNAPFDARMLAYVGIPVAGVEDTQVQAALVNEHRSSFALNDLAREAGLPPKSDESLHRWMSEHLVDDGRALKPTRKSCAPHYWRVPAEIITEYAVGDAALTLGVDDHLLQKVRAEGMSDVYELETALQPVLLRMHLAGVRVDRPRAMELHRRLSVELDRAAAELKHEWGIDRDTIRRPKIIGELFDRLGIKYPMTTGRRDRKTGEIIEGSQLPSIRAAWLETLNHPIGAMIRRMRKVMHYRDVFVNNYILENTKDSDVIHGEFHALRGDKYGTISGRLSSGGDLNLQNVPARDEEWAPLIRSLFRPMRDDQDWLRGDYSQIEYRLFAHYSGILARLNGGVSQMEEAYVADPMIDFHQWVADTARIKRKRAKNVNFCRLYGGGIPKIAATAGCSIAEAEEFVAAYDAAIPEAQKTARWVSSRAARKGFIWTYGGRKLRFETEGARAMRLGGEVRGHPGRFAMVHAALNRVLQGSSADFTKRAMIEVDKIIDWESTIMHLSVHDELDFSIPAGAAGDGVASEIQQIMQDVGKRPMWNGERMRVPVIVEMERGRNWGMWEDKEAA